MNRRSVRRSIVHVVSDGVFVPLAIIYAIAAAAFGCSGSVSINSGVDDPNRALGTYRFPGTFGESDSRVFFGYWLTGNNEISSAAAQSLQAAVGSIANTATVTIVPNSILYEERALEVGTGRTITVSISGTWSYDSRTRILVNWGSAFVTASTFPPTPPFDVATVGTRIEGPQPGDLIFSANNWNQLQNLVPGPIDGIFNRVN